ncbi:hypothetical protein P168DRAFT_291449 [Aspergillus campestris IBT 28561]|uniref:Purine and uridine phosphorylase n=1 Tax=Aspergillus campestris (strain IBT 28561) TaxID=1392248 RepID=A0A2I1D0C0_ASPC2|nr:uncharacterized protein P168DRAFT_291449 [Aspergillus campestris IBT 28561]PKY03316.1 hypothetical protein P168DRAFT_291449 [Aspergillus campestris IBT 28561]
MGQRRQRKLRDALLQNITDICDKEGFADRTRPMLENDRPYRANYGHMHRVLKDCSVCAHVAEGGPVVCERALTMSCEQLGCDEDQTMSRERKANDTPAIHFGGFSSSDQVMKSAQDRDRIAKQEDILGFEMESAGVWDNFPTVVIKGVCDYADSHKNKKWRQYASVTAAAGAKAFLQQWMMTNQNNTRATGGAGFETAAGNGIGQQRALLENNGNVGIQGLYQAFHGHVTMR